MRVLEQEDLEKTLSWGRFREVLLRGQGVRDIDRLLLLVIIKMTVLIIQELVIMYFITLSNKSITMFRGMMSCCTRRITLNSSGTRGSSCKHMP